VATAHLLLRRLSRAEPASQWPLCRRFSLCSKHNRWNRSWVFAEAASFLLAVSRMARPSKAEGLREEMSRLIATAP
jgi:hypothetical protein